MGIRAGCIGLAVAAAIFGGFSVREAVAANGAYAVDAADISEVGSCKVESWLSAATNTDFSAVANPSCAVNIFRPVSELADGAATQRRRLEHEHRAEGQVEFHSDRIGKWACRSMRVAPLTPRPATTSLLSPSCR